MSHIKTLGSVCSGIEAASFVFEKFGVESKWFSEIADFPSQFLKMKYPHIPNHGNMDFLCDKINKGEIEIPDMLCGGTPCQAFSLAGWKNGLDDHRGQLTLEYIEILDAIDNLRKKNNKDNAVFFWENVEGVLTDKTNAFGCFLAGLAGYDSPLEVKKWSSAGVVYGPKRNIAWRVLDAKYFGIPQQRKRLYVIGGGKEFCPEDILLEFGEYINDPYTKIKNKPKDYELFSSDEENIDLDYLNKKKCIKDNHCIEIFRSYSDCLYSAYGTKWNGNAAAYNGSLFVSQNNRLRRLTPLECERLMGFPDNYTLLGKCRDTNRYQAIGNSWAVPVINWIANKLINNTQRPLEMTISSYLRNRNEELILLDGFTKTSTSKYINASNYIYDWDLKNILDIIDVNAPEKFYISSKGCAGILRRKKERNLNINSRLEEILKANSL